MNIFVCIFGLSDLPHDWTILLWPFTLQVHLASWSADVNNYRDIAQPLVQHLKVSKGGKNGEPPSLKLRKLLKNGWLEVGRQHFFLGFGPIFRGYLLALGRVCWTVGAFWNTLKRCEENQWW